MPVPRRSRLDGEGLLSIQKSLMKISGDKPRFQLVFEMGVVILIIVGFLSYRQITSYMSFVSKIAQVDEIREHLLQAKLNLAEAESAERNFIQSGQATFAEAYNEAQYKFSAQWQRADFLARKAKMSIPESSEIIKQGQLKFALMTETLKIRAQGHRQEAEQRLVLNLQQEGSLAQLLEKVDLNYFKEIQGQRDLLNSMGANITWIIFLGTALAVALLLMWRNLSAREKKKLEGLTILLSSKQNELLEAQVKADEADRIKTDFLNNMSHEIRTPLNAIFGLGQLLSKSKLSAEQSHHLQGIQGSAKSLLDLVNGVLDFARIENHGLDVDMKPICLPDLVKEVGEILQGQAEIKGLELRLVNEVKGKLFISDKVRLRQILLNLAGNAIKFTSSGFVEIHLSNSLSNYGSKVGIRFDVIDTGIGIAEESQDKIFQNFYQTDSSVSRKFGGTGLGLAICKAIVSRMDGNIGFKSQSGVGSQFWFEIPMQALADSHLQEAESVAKLDSQVVNIKNNIKVLIVEDNHLNQVVLAGFLKELGCQVHVTSSGAEALTYLKEDDVQIIFLDCQMPEMDGFQVAQNLRQIEKMRWPTGEKHWRVIATTAHTTNGYKEKCLAAGMDEFLSKPIQLEDLQSHLNSSAKVAKVEAQVLDLDKRRWEKLQKVSSENGNFLQEIAQIFLSSFPQKMQQIKMALSQKDYQQVREIAHFLKSSCSDIGANSLSLKFAEIEEAIEQGLDLSFVANQIQSLSIQFEQIEPEIRAVA